MPHIASTLSCPTEYTDWKRVADGTLVKGHSVVVKGGFGLADKNFITPTGAVLTEVSADDVAFLEQNVHFKEHQRGGFVKILSKREDGEKAADKMTLGDKSQPMHPSQFKDKTDIESLSVNTGPVQ